MGLYGPPPQEYPPYAGVIFVVMLFAVILLMELRARRAPPSSGAGFWSVAPHAMIMPVRLIDGRITLPMAGPLWRRWNGKCWEYRQHEETDEQFWDRNR